MKQQDLKAHTKVAIDRAVASHEAPGAQLTLEQLKQVSGGALDASSKDACWKGYTVELENASVSSI